MPRAADGNSRKKHDIREFSRRSPAAKKPTDHPAGGKPALDRAAVNEVNAPTPRTRRKGHAIKSNVADANNHAPGRDCAGPIVSIAINVKLGALKRFISNSVPPFHVFSENFAALLAVSATIYLCFVGGWTRAEMLEWLVACGIYGELSGGTLPRTKYHCIMAVCALFLLLR